MPMQYKIVPIKKLGEAGYNTSRIRREKLFSESTLQKFRNKQPVSWENIEMLCQLLNCQPGDILEYVPDGDVLRDSLD